MADELDECITVGNWAKQNGYPYAAKVLGREGQRLLGERKHPRKALVEVRLKQGGRAWLPKACIRDAEEIED